MKISCVTGSRADRRGMSAIEGALRDRGVDVLEMCAGDDVATDAAACVVIGDRFEMAQTALEYHESMIDIAHIHAGELTGQEPDDTYRGVISTLSRWLFTMGHRYLDGRPVAFNCGSPYITAAHNTPISSPYWGEGDGKKVFVAFNPLPRNPDETKDIADDLAALYRDNDYRFVTIAPNTDRHREMFDCTPGIVHEWLSPAGYLSYLASADAIVGNTSAGLIENCVYGTPYVCVGSRQMYRKHPPHTIRCEPHRMQEYLLLALKMKRQPSDTYGKPESAGIIADTLIKEIEHG